MKNLLKVSLVGILVIALISTFSLIGCKTATTTTTAAETTATATTTAAAETTAAASSTTAPSKPITVGYSNGLITHAWRTQMMADIQQDFNIYKGKGWCDKLIIQNAGFDVDLQINQIRNLINSKVDLLLINPNSVTALNPVIEEAVKAGILVIVIDQTVASEAPYQILGNSVQWMTDQAKWVFEKMGKKGKVVYLSGVDGQPGNTDRDNGFMETLKNYPDIKLLTKANGNWDPSTSQQAMADVLAAFPEIDAVVAHDGEVMGTLRAFDAAGRKHPIINGDYMVNFVEYWVKNINTVDAFTLINSPGMASCLGLGVGVRMLRGMKLKDGFFKEDPLHNIKSPTVALIPYTNKLDNSNVVEMYNNHINTRGIAEYLDIWPSQDEIDALFVK
jgi:ribose transport system substrate-binding protein